MQRHALPAEIFVKLAEGGGGSVAAAHLVAAQRSKHLLLIRTLVDITAGSGHRDGPAVRAAFDALATIEKEAPTAVSLLLRYPAVGAWALHTVLRLRQDRMAQAHPGRLAGVAAAAAIRGRVRLVIDVPAVNGAVSLPSIGVMRLPSCQASATIRSYRDGAEIIVGTAGIEISAYPHADSRGWRGIRQLSMEADGRSIVLLIDDLDPYRFPGMVSNRDRLSNADAAAWQRRLHAGWRILVRHHPQVAAEVATAMTVITPLPADPGGQVSATSREAFGCMAASMPADSRSAAVTFAHEIQHAKMTALMDLFAMVRQGSQERFYVPWRNDPRPTAAVLHGAYAHTGVAAFWERQRHHEYDPRMALRAHTEFALWRRASYDAACLLISRGALTETGRTFVHDMLSRLTFLNRKDVPNDALFLAEQKLKDRRRS